MLKKRIFFTLFIFVHIANASDCKELKHQLDNYDTACKVSTDLSSGCGVLATATATFSFGFWGLICAVPTVVGSGVCALRDIKKRWYEACRQGEVMPLWTKSILPPSRNKKGYEKQIFLRHMYMEENNALYEQKVDAFLEACSEIDLTLEENRKLFDSKMQVFEDEYVAKAKEIEEEFQKSILK